MRSTHKGFARLTKKLGRKFDLFGRLHKRAFTSVFLYCAVLKKIKMV